MSYVLLTGVTGLVGRYLIKDLLLAGRQIAVLVRPTRRATARQRVDAIMAYWDEQLGRPLPRPVVLQGDITEIDLGLDPRQLKWVAEHCRSIIHNAASLTFQSTGSEAEPWRSNVSGTRHVLEVCRQAAIREFHHVSTAYVCGLRHGRIMEAELDVGQTLSNDYEHSKVQAEKMVRESDFIDSLTVYRPAIIVGDSKTGYTTTYHGFYAPLQLCYTLMQAQEPNVTGRQFTSARFPLGGLETKNLVPVDWVSEALVHIFNSPQQHGRTYHLTPQHPITVRLLADILEEATGFYSVSFQGQGRTIQDPTEYEQLFQDMISIYSSYWKDDPTFDRTHITEAAPHLPCPHVDRTMLTQMAQYAIGVNFSGPRTKCPPPAFDVAGVIDPLLEQDGPLPNDAAYRLGLQVLGNGGGDWQFQMQNGRLISADEGLPDMPHVTCRLNVSTFGGLVHGTLTPESAVDSGQIEVSGDNGARSEAVSLLRALARSTHSDSLVSQS